jgi:D-glycero-D-manno-heptose 1,7-bisphosphate phosphatase
MGIDAVRRAVFLDRDGVLNRNVFNRATGEWESPLRAEDFELAEGVLQTLAALREDGYLLFLVSNQPNYAKGKATLKTLEAIHLRLLAVLEEAGIEFAEFYYCLHHPEGVVEDYSGPCACRKPSPYFLLKARGEFGIEMNASWMIGDCATDVECGRAAGTRTIRISATGCRAEADFCAEDLASAVEIIHDSDRHARNG